LAAPHEVRTDRLTLRTVRDGDSIELHAVGEIDVSTLPLLEEQWAGALLLEPVYLTLDLAGVAFIDSTGLQFLLRATAESGSTRVEFRACSEVVRRAIEICGMTKYLPLTG